MGKPPERIYLQHDDPYEPYAENTWNIEPVGEADCDTKYIRYDLYQASHEHFLEASGKAEDAIELLKAELARVTEEASLHKAQNMLFSLANDDDLAERERLVRTARNDALREAANEVAKVEGLEPMETLVVVGSILELIEETEE